MKSHFNVLAASYAVAKLLETDNQLIYK